MIGLFVLIILGLWGLFAIWLGKLLSKKVFSWFTTNQATGEISTVGSLITILLIVLVFISPVADQLIAYPKWQQLCASTGDFEWGPGMDEKKAFGRDLILTATIHQTKIFPNIDVTYFSSQFKDSQTGELILNMPHSSYYGASGMFYIPSSSGSGSAIFLNECTTSIKSQKVMDYLNQFNLNVVEDRS